MNLEIKELLLEQENHFRLRKQQQEVGDLSIKAVNLLHQQFIVTWGSGRKKLILPHEAHCIKETDWYNFVTRGCMHLAMECSSMTRDIYGSRTKGRHCNKC